MFLKNQFSRQQKAKSSHALRHYRDLFLYIHFKLYIFCFEFFVLEFSSLISVAVSKRERERDRDSLIMADVLLCTPVTDNLLDCVIFLELFFFQNVCAVAGLFFKKKKK